MIFYTSLQGSAAWLEERKGVVTGSRFKVCRERLKSGAMTKSCMSYAMDTARERVGGAVLGGFVNAAMRMGQDQEVFARAAYERRTGNLVDEVGFIATDDRRFGVSPDGLIDDDGVLEIKTMVGSETLFTAVADGDISEYIDQCNGYLWLLGRQWVDLVLWAPDLAPLGIELTIVRITRDEAAIETLESDLLEFARLVDQNEEKLRRLAKAKTESLAQAA